MDIKQFKKDWDIFLIDIEKSEKQVATESGQSQQNLNKKIIKGSIRYLELSEIVENMAIQSVLGRRTNRWSLKKKRR